MYQFVLVMHIIAAACIIVLVLVQQGKGATMGSSFGAGASQTVFGSRGAGSFLLRLTLAFVFAFFATSIALNWMSSHAVKHGQVLRNQLPAGLLEAEQTEQVERSENTQPEKPLIPTSVESATQKPTAPSHSSSETAALPEASASKQKSNLTSAKHTVKKTATIKSAKNVTKRHTIKPQTVSRNA